MFAQLMITVLLVLALTEILSRVLLGRSAIAVLRRPGNGPAPVEDEPTDAVTRDAEERLEERMHDLEEARRRVVVTEETTTVTEELEERERELREIEARLEAIEAKRDISTNG